LMPSTSESDSPSLALWGGYECTVNRVGDQWFDQTMRSGHQDRAGDLDLFAGLGLRALRYPALWERISPETPEERDWRWTDERLPRIRELGMNPIVTLCHHGSGPRYTSLLDESFAPGLARHAQAVAERYPWITDWTPVNEPLTTARFSALYGYWYPHTLDESAFWVALLNEIDATRLSMKAIREVNPQARLVQTDDLGFCHATAPLQREADFQNERRWMGWDLLCGRVVPGHPLWERLVAAGLEARLQVIADDPCPPDIIGINHYLSSERLLDHRVGLHSHRSVADQATGVFEGLEFVDVDAIRHREAGVVGLKRLLREAWERYGIPIAVTECHNGATRDEQARWIVDVWGQAQELRAEGVDLRAVTAWSLLGAYDWNRMVTRFIGHYEPGVFDVRSGVPRPTLVSRVLESLAAGREPSSPVLRTPGWWRRSALIDGASEACPHRHEVSLRDPGALPALMIVGADTTLGRLATLACEARGLHYAISENGSRLDLRTCAPWAVIDARERQRGAGAPRTPDLCDASEAPCAVFAHKGATPRLVAERTLILRCAPIYTPDDNGPATMIVDRLLDGGSVTADPGRPWDAVYGPDVVDTALDLLLDGASGVFDLHAPESWSELDFARAVAAVVGCEPDLVRQAQRNRFSAAAASPLSASYLPPGETTVERFVRERRHARDGYLTIERRFDETRFEAGE
ncbi:MAG TPA: family 1 glycosylhydrolase, partial [Brevundimonas sp.]|nr:family 1 glycosylhydrolase [Brevundimonas sp.]